LIDEHILKDTHILKLNILGCDKTTPLNRILSRDSQGLVTKRRVRAKIFHQGGDKDNKMGIEKRENLNLDLLHLLSIGLS
jgi:hypothetical protein